MLLFCVRIKYVDTWTTVWQTTSRPCLDTSVLFDLHWRHNKHGGMLISGCLRTNRYTNTSHLCMSEDLTYQDINNIRHIIQWHELLYSSTCYTNLAYKQCEVSVMCQHGAHSCRKQRGKIWCEFYFFVNLQTINVFNLNFYSAVDMENAIIITKNELVSQLSYKVSQCFIRKQNL